MTKSKTQNTEQSFIDAYNTKKAFRKAMSKAFIAIGMGLEEFEDPATWAECMECLETYTESNVKVEIIQGVPGKTAMLYPLATFGWDGGNAIVTEQLNLTDLVYSHVSSGPCANIVKRTNSSYPGVALHHGESDASLIIQLF